MRKCIVNGEKGYFHQWYVRTNVIEPSQMIVGEPRVQIQYILGIVEFEDGRIEEILPKEIKFQNSTENNKQKTVGEIIKEVKEDICDNYCKYRDTADEDYLCDRIRNGDACPLDRLQ